MFDATCGGLLTYPAEPFPQGLRLVPEIADGPPTITNGGKTYTFTIRKGFRFSTGSPVTARSFAHTINRLLSPTMKSRYAEDYADILGARKVIEGKAETAFGIVARGNTLIIRLTKPAGDFTVTRRNRLRSARDSAVRPRGCKRSGARRRSLLHL